MDTFRAIRRVLWITLVLNLIATIAKLTVGYWTGSLSLIADGYDSAFDGATNVIGLVGMHFAAQPTDEEHPYGHRKVESLTALIIAGFLFLTTWELIRSAVDRLSDPPLSGTEVNIWSYGALFVSIAVHVFVVWYELRAGRRMHSEVLVSDALHTRADILISLSVLGGMIAVGMGYPLADPIIALVVALLIGKIGIDIIRESSPALMDHVVILPGRVEQVALAVPGVIGCHQARSRGHGEAVYADLHIQVDPALRTSAAHAIAHQVQLRLQERLPRIQDVTIHVEPTGSSLSGSRRHSMVDSLRQLADRLELDVHRVWALEAGGQYQAGVHLELDGALSLRRAHDLASALEERACADIPGLMDLTTHIEPRTRLARVPTAEGDREQVSEAVRAVIAGLQNADACHQIEVRRGEGGWALSMHCRLPGEMPMAEAHSISTRLETQLRVKIPALGAVIIHTEPLEE